MSETFVLKLRFDGKNVGSEGLRLYDGTTSLHGFARALQITSHAYLNDNPVSKATALSGGVLYFGPPKKGSVLFNIFAKFDRKPKSCLLYTSPSPRDQRGSRMPSSA